MLWPSGPHASASVYVCPVECKIFTRHATLTCLHWNWTCCTHGGHCNARLGVQTRQDSMGPTGQPQLQNKFSVASPPGVPHLTYACNGCCPSTAGCVGGIAAAGLAGPACASEPGLCSCHPTLINDSTSIEETCGVGLLL